MGLLTHVESEIRDIVIKVLEDLDLYHPPEPTTNPTVSPPVPSPGGGGDGGGTGIVDGPPKQQE